MESMISVIIPVYNVAAYLPECLNSVLGQSYRNMEIILVDDGSKDASGAICDQYADKDSRITVIHQANGGAAAAKNAGLRIARGKYLSFVDSDDFLEPDAYRHMVSVLEANDADAVQCCFREVVTDGTIDCVTIKEPMSFSVQEYLKRYTTDWTCCLLWDKLYKHELFDGIFFEEGHIVDDEFFTYQGIMNAKKIIHDPKIVYNYRKRYSSVTIKPEYRERTIFDKLDYLEKRRKNIAKAFPELKEIFDLHYLDMLLWMSRDADVTVACIDEIKKKIYANFKHENQVSVDWRRKYNLLRILVSRSNKLVRDKNAKQQFDPEKYFA